jgi:hypothetical protein
VTVTDRTATDGFRLAGPGVAKTTGVKLRGSATWKVTLQAGRYSFGSSRRPKLRRIFTISGPYPYLFEFVARSHADSSGSVSRENEVTR